MIMKAFLYFVKIILILNNVCWQLYEHKVQRPHHRFMCVPSVNNYQAYFGKAMCVYVLQTFTKYSDSIRTISRNTQDK